MYDCLLILSHVYLDTMVILIYNGRVCILIIDFITFVQGYVLVHA